jgi:hypothetical protein
VLFLPGNGGGQGVPELGSALERRTDEDAAHAVASRALAARSLARAARSAPEGARHRTAPSAPTALTLPDVTSARGRFLEILHP